MAPDVALPSRDLFVSLVDDAAVFPPGNAPLDQALHLHDGLTGDDSSCADLVGPLLIPAAKAADLLPMLGERTSAVYLGVIARPGTPIEVVTTALDALDTHDAASVSVVEVAATEDWARLIAYGLPLAVEVPRDPAAQADVLDGLAEAVKDDVDVIAKLRTQSTPDQPLPTAEELAAFLHGVHDRGLSFKLTGGLHHTVAGTRPSQGSDDLSVTEDQHGVLNVLVATAGLLDGADLATTTATLRRTDAVGLADDLRDIDDDEADAIRKVFASFGCCGVTDPIGELVELGLIAD